MVAGGGEISGVCSEFDSEGMVWVVRSTEQKKKVFWVMVADGGKK